MSANVKGNRCGAVDETVTVWCHEGCVCHLSISWHLTPSPSPTLHLPHMHTLPRYLAQFLCVYIKEDSGCHQEENPWGRVQVYLCHSFT